MGFGKAVILLGAPGAGKGTQAERLAASRGFQHVSTGDLLREAVRNGTELGRKSKAIMERGELVPDELVSALVSERLKRGRPDQGIILDGFPRTAAQAEFLSKALNGVRPQAISIAVDEGQIVKRLSGRRTCARCGKIFNVFFSPSAEGDQCEACHGPLVQREDDREEVIRERLRVYCGQTAPLIDYYLARGEFQEVDGDRPAPEVARAIEALVS